MDAVECVTFTRGDPRKQEQIYGLNTYQGPKLVVHHEFNEFPNIIQYDDINPTISSPNALCDIQDLAKPQNSHRYRKALPHRNYNPYRAEPHLK